MGLDYRRRTAIKKRKYDYEVIAPDAQFAFQLELVLREKDLPRASQVESLLYILLQGLKHQEIFWEENHGGVFGRIELVNEHILRLMLAQPEDRHRWKQLTGNLFEPNCQLEDLAHEISITPTLTEIAIDFRIPSSILIRSANPDPEGEDVVHLMSNQQRVIPGTSWSGAIRNAMEKIGRALNKTEEVKALEDRLLGFVQIPDNHDLGSLAKGWPKRCGLDSMKASSWKTLISCTPVIGSIDLPEVS